MTDSKANPDVTVRGGLVNVPASDQPSRPPRHQPDTPRTKKQTTVKPDHIPTSQFFPEPTKKTSAPRKTKKAEPATTPPEPGDSPPEKTQPVVDKNVEP